MRAFAFDFETYVMVPGIQFPPAVCMSFATVEGGALREVGLLTYAEGLDRLRAELDAGSLMVGANTAFDVLVSINSAVDPHAMIARWVGAYNADRVVDVLHRQTLLNLAAGIPAHRYSLESVADECQIQHALNKSFEGRLRFGELDGVPITEYPADARDYALEDARATAAIFLVQERIRSACVELRASEGGWYGEQIALRFPGYDPLLDQFNQARGSVALRAISGNGLRANAVDVEAFAGMLSTRRDELRATLVAEGLVRREVKRDKAALEAYAERNGLTAALTDPKTGKLSLTGKRLAACGDPWLAHWPHYKQPTSEAVLLEAGLATEHYVKDTKRAAARVWAAFTRRGEEVPSTATGPKLDSDTCTKSKDPLLVMYSELSSADKTLGNDVVSLRRAAREPLHARYDDIKETGRTGTSNPNVQNLPRDPGVRECYAPRPGCVFVDADYSAVELYTFAQICLWVVGWSRLADALNQNPPLDPHLMIAAAILGISYEDAAARKKAPEVKQARTAGKGVNFGRKGGLGARRFVEYAWNNYGIEIDEAGARRLIDLHDATWLEMPSYSNWIKSLGVAALPDLYQVVQPWSGRLRADCGYCDAHNSPFQGLAADVAKRALWYVYQAQCGLLELGDTDPLVGTRTVLFTHDSITLEAPEARCHEVGLRLEELMVRAAREILPDVVPKAVPTASRQLSKLADDPILVNGRLVPWDVRDACRKALASTPDDWTKGPRAWLEKATFPDHIIAEVLGPAYHERQAA